MGLIETGSSNLMRRFAWYLKNETPSGQPLCRSETSGTPGLRRYYNNANWITKMSQKSRSLFTKEVDSLSLEDGALIYYCFAMSWLARIVVVPSDTIIRGQEKTMNTAAYQAIMFFMVFALSFGSSQSAHQPHLCLLYR
jgi:hypothetical protein